MISILTSVDLPRIQQWYGKAINEIQVRRFLSQNPTWDTQAELNTDWSNTYLMDSRDLGLAVVHPGRVTSNQNGTLSLWVLPGSHQQLVAGRLLLKAFEYAQSINVKYLGLGVHASNSKSLKLCEGLQSGGKIGIGREEAWDPFLAQWVDVHHFRINVAHFMESRNAKTTYE